MRIVFKNSKFYYLAWATIVLDQLSKYFARGYLPVIENSGLPFFGINLPGVFDLVFVLAAFMIFLWLVYRNRATVNRTGTALVLSAAVSNIFDRLVRGSVTDFIDLGIGNTFNLADIAIMIGIILLIIKPRIHKSHE